ncbi:MAG: bifunctional riboflavin kinase/FAD synthetase [Pedosphaera sp.]|nr:bifunctional riboflavin kinase/FAD synthetase [Pedosphaera sp.]MSU43121.1 bifunctional riboflavin kinase/FAD synthetase [Pedosphaera sp.]
MRILREAREARPPTGKAAIAIGMFDGVHLGHQQVLRQTVADARDHEAMAIAVTFDRHPAAVLSPANAPALIQTQAQRLRAIAALEVDAALVLEFDAVLSRMPAPEFITQLIGHLGHCVSVCVGARFAFGHQRAGNVALLKQLGAQLGFAVHGLANVALDGEMVSSTRVRKAIASGDLDGAGQMLGRPYVLAGTVVTGDGRGRTWGFPTANLDAAGLCLPPAGVYAAHARVADKAYRAAVNIGLRPTLNEPVPSLHVEAHLLDFAGDCYGQEMELSFVQRLRGEERFASVEALRAQIARDVQSARAAFGV